MGRAFKTLARPFIFFQPSYKFTALIMQAPCFDDTIYNRNERINQF